MVGESFHHMVAGVRTVTIFRKGATAQKLWRLFAFPLASACLIQQKRFISTAIATASSILDWSFQKDYKLGRR
jgi:hypothetical protein